MLQGFSGRISSSLLPPPGIIVIPTPRGLESSWRCKSTKCLLSVCHHSLPWTKLDKIRLTSFLWIGPWYKELTLSIRPGRLMDKLWERFFRLDFLPKFLPRHLGCYYNGESSSLENVQQRGLISNPLFGLSLELLLELTKIRLKKYFQTSKISQNWWKLLRRSEPRVLLWFLKIWGLAGEKIELLKCVLTCDYFRRTFLWFWIWCQKIFLQMEKIPAS